LPSGFISPPLPFRTSDSERRNRALFTACHLQTIVLRFSRRAFRLLRMTERDWQRVCHSEGHLKDATRESAKVRCASEIQACIRSSRRRLRYLLRMTDAVSLRGAAKRRCGNRSFVVDFCGPETAERTPMADLRGRRLRLARRFAPQPIQLTINKRQLTIGCDTMYRFMQCPSVIPSERSERRNRPLFSRPQACADARRKVREKRQQQSERPERSCERRAAGEGSGRLRTLPSRHSRSGASSCTAIGPDLS